MPQISISKGRVLTIGEPPNGVNVAVEKDYVDFSAWGEGVEVVVRCTRPEIEAYAREIGAAMATGTAAPRLILPGRA